MAKATSKSKSESKPVAKSPAKKAAPKTTKAKSSAWSIEDACVEALSKLKALNIDGGLQADIEWCLGSYRFDKNPAGLYDMATRAVEVFKAELSKKTKGVTAKLVKDIEKALQSR